MPYCFIIDDSPCMGEPNFDMALTPLDICKAAVEKFLESIKTAPTSDKFVYMLLNTGPDRSCILSLYGEPAIVLETALKNIQVSDTPRDVSYAISLAFTTINKYRMRNGTDQFCGGRKPWVLEPTNVIFLTTGKSLEGKGILLSKGSMSAGSDLYLEPFRWDQKFFTFLIDRPSTSSQAEQVDSKTISIELLALAEATGGEVIVCKGLQNTVKNVKLMVHKLLTPSVVCKIVNESSRTGGHEPAQVAVRLAVRSPAEWPIPEDFWIKNVDNLPIREAHPTLRVDKSYGNGAAEMAMIRELGNPSLTLAFYIYCCVYSVYSFSSISTSKH
jgi:hypothetical protein